MPRAGSRDKIQQIRTEYALNTYLQLFTNNVSDSLPGSNSLVDALNDLVELAIVRVGVCGAFVVLTDGCSQRLIASGEALKLNSFQEDGWLWLFRQTLAVDISTDDQTFSVSVLSQNDHTSALTSVSDAPHLSFYAGTPITSNKGQHIGAFFVVDNTKRTQISAAEAKHLTTTAKKCINLLDFAHERRFHDRWSNVQKQLDVFVQLRAQTIQALEDSPISPQRSTQSSSLTEYLEFGEPETQSFLTEDDFGINCDESKRLARAESERNERVTRENHTGTERTQTPEHENKDEHKRLDKDTTYRKVFHRASQCLKKAFEADGALFVNGLIGLHGDIQPISESENELLGEQSRLSVRDPSSQSMKTDLQISSREREIKGKTTYTSADFRKGVESEIPAEILSLSTHATQPEVVTASENTEGLRMMDDSFLQRLMVRYPHGAVWYFSNGTTTRVIEESPVAEDIQEMAERLRRSFPGVVQLIFQPLTDPTSLKRLAGCFLWRVKARPLYTDRIDLPSLNGFLHTVESEIARLDAMAAVKQQDAFVSSVSHELRTPLHGILGAVQLLDDTDTDPLQKALVSTINSCGSTLHETLTSVLSYAQINQFERRQHMYRQRRAPDAVWALPDKRGFSSGPDRDFQGLYICTNVAMLCEETVGVLEAGQSFTKSGHSDDVIVVCNIDYEENWEFHTEPGALRRIVSNLIGNALKYTSKGSVVVTLSASRTITNSNSLSNDLTSGRTTIIRVKDTGRGMSKEFLENSLFVPFTQEDSTTSQGVGLGMSIVKSLVSLLNGEISVQSEVEKGTEMTVKIPMDFYSGEPDGNERTTADTKHMVQTLRLRTLSVVVFGFPNFVRDSLESYLRNWYHVKILEDAEDANPDIVLFDEGDEKAIETVRRTARAYGRRGVLLSIVMTPSKLAEQGKNLLGYSKMERVPRPLGPIKVGKALLACVAKMDELRKEETGGTDQGNDRSNDDETTQQKPQPIQYERKISIRPANKESNQPEVPGDNTKASSSPAKDVSSSDSPLPMPQGSVAKNAHNSISNQPCSQLRVLLVDDNALNRKLLGAFLKKNGYQNVTQADDGLKAVESFRKEAFDLIFMDISMPVMDGFEATREIRAIETEGREKDAVQSAIVVALTGLASERDQEKAFDAGVDLFMTKPVQFSKLSALLKRCEEGDLKRRK